MLPGLVKLLLTGELCFDISVVDRGTVLTFLAAVNKGTVC